MDAVENAEKKKAASGLNGSSRKTFYGRPTLVPRDHTKNIFTTQRQGRKPGKSKQDIFRLKYTYGICCDSMLRRREKPFITSGSVIHDRHILNSDGVHLDKEI